MWLCLKSMTFSYSFPCSTQQTPVKSLCVVPICSAFLPLDIQLPKQGRFCTHLHSHTMLVTSPQWKEAELIKFSESENESHSVMSDSLRPHWLYSPWNSPGQNTGVGSLSLLQGIFQTQGSNPGLLHCRRILYQLSHKEALSFQRDMQILWEAHLKELINLFIIYTFINYLPAFYYWARFMKIVVKKKTELVSSLIKLIIVWWRHRNKRKILNHQCCYIKCDQLNLTKICKSKEMF